MIVNLLLILLNLVAYSSGLWQADLIPYPGYVASPVPAGQLYVEESLSGKGIDIGYKFTNLGVNNTGGFHIHVGKSCSSHNQVGGHYWGNNAYDPWTNITYQSDAHGIAKGNIFLSEFNTTEVFGRAVVVHDPAGVRVGCGLLTHIPTLALTLSRYPGYNGTLNAGGSVRIHHDFSRGGITLTYVFIGLEPTATGGWHVHSGADCSSHALVGGHYFNDPNMYYYVGSNQSDPWNSVKYTSDMNGIATGQVFMPGFTVLDVSGRAVVVHDMAGGRVGCALTDYVSDYVLPMLSATMFKYPGYNGPLTNIGGQVRISEITGGISLTYGFIGLENNVTGGWHVHVGMSCDVASNVGGHFYPGMLTDPWNSVKYTSDGYGTSSGKINMTGFTISMVSNRTIVIHDSSGTRVACGHINPIPTSPPTPIPPTTSSPTPPIPPTTSSPTPPIPPTTSSPTPPIPPTTSSPTPPIPPTTSSPTPPIPPTKTSPIAPPTPQSTTSPIAPPTPQSTTSPIAPPTPQSTTSPPTTSWTGQSHSQSSSASDSKIIAPPTASPVVTSTSNAERFSYSFFLFTLLIASFLNV